MQMLRYAPKLFELTMNHAAQDYRKLSREHENPELMLEEGTLVLAPTHIVKRVAGQRKPEPAVGSKWEKRSGVAGNPSAMLFSREIIMPLEEGYWLVRSIEQRGYTNATVETFIKMKGNTIKEQLPSVDGEECLQLVPYKGEVG